MTTDDRHDVVSSAIAPDGELVAGRYRLEARVGEGGMAEVFRATDVEYGRTVAMKFLRASLGGTSSADRFRREISIAATLSHPHIVPLFDSGVWRDRLYYVMPLVEGRNLREVLDQSGPVSLPRAIAIARDVGEALAYAHAHGVVHRDIKPANIILTDEYAVVSDFGVAKAVGSLARADLTWEGMAVGTPLYMAPEQATDPGGVTARSDTYSFGCVVYEMLTGTPPFPPLHGPREVPSLDTVDPSIPHGVAEAVRRAIDRVPARRFDTVADFVENLERGAGGRSVDGLPAERGSRARLLGAVGVVAVVLVLLALWRGGGGGGGDGWDGDRPRSVLVVPFADARATPAERDLALTLADELTFELSGWDEVRPVARIVQSGAMHDLGLEGPYVSNVGEAVDLARRLGVAGVALVRASTLAGGDSARVEYALLRTEGGLFGGGGSEVGTPTVVQAGLDPVALIEPMARRLLGLEAASEPVVGRRAGTTSPSALQQYDDGVEALAAWRLDEALEHFRAALAEDSTFAMAHLRAGQALYWQVVDDLGGAAEELGPRILQSAGAARRHARGQDLSEHVLDHIDGFFAFATGDYVDARVRFESAVDRDPTDVFAHLMLGSVEVADPWVAEGPVHRPRSDLNAALAAFDRAVELNPDFEIGYGHLFTVARMARNAADSWGCYGYETPRDVSIAPWDARRPDQLEFFCLVAGEDSLRWVPGETNGGIDREAARRAADQLVARAVTRLERWIAFKPESARPLEELSRVYRDDYLRLGRAAPEAIEAAATRAAEPLQRAVALQGSDPNDLFALANLEGAAGDVTRAVGLVQMGLRLHAERSPGQDRPSLAANPLLGAGRLDEVLELLEGAQRGMGVPLSSGGYVEVPGEAVLAMQRVLAAGALLADEQELVPLLRRVEAAWAGPAWSAEEKRAMRDFIGRLMVPALAPHADLVRAWVAVEDPDPQARLARRVAEGGDGAGQALSEAAAEEPPARPSVGRSLTLARLALAMGRADLATPLLASIDSVPLPVQQFSSAWGVRTSARLLLAEALLAQGEIVAARDAYDRFRRVVPTDDGVPLSLARRAAALSARFAGGV